MATITRTDCLVTLYHVLSSENMARRREVPDKTTNPTRNCWYNIQTY